MFEYEKYADGARTLAALEALIAGEEAAESEFLGNTVVTDDGKATNLVRFKEVRTATGHEPLRLLSGGERPPSGSIEIWNGQMVVANVAQPVVAYRAERKTGAAARSRPS